MLEYLATLELPELEVLTEGDGSSMVAFREYGHDAPEVAHSFTNTDSHQTRELGVLALLQARGNVAAASEVLISTNGSTDAYNRRLIVEVLLRVESSFLSNGEKLIEAGLSFPTHRAPHSYQRRYDMAQQHSAGIFALLPREVALSEEAKPWSLRQHFAQPRCGAFTHQCLRVTCRATKRHASHTIIRPSYIPRAGRALMVMQQSPPRGAATPAVYIERGEQVATYSMAPMGAEEVSQLPTRDYLFCYEARGKVEHYSAHSYNGTNIGRFINQGGLLPAFRRLVAVSSRQFYPSLQARAVEEEAEKYCNVRYTQGPHRELIVELKDRLYLRSEHQELLANYGILAYWVPYVCSNATSLGEDSQLVQAILWCALSEESNWTSRQRQEARQLLIGGGVDPDTVDYDCPWPELVSSTRQRKRPT